MRLPDNVTSFLDRHGKRRYRFRKTGMAQVYLPGSPGDDQFETVLALAKAGRHLDAKRKARRPLTKVRRRRQHHNLPDGELIYFVRIGSSVKIGWTKNLRKRLEHLQTASPRGLKLLATTSGSREFEQALHHRFADSRLNGEWFKVTPQLLQMIENLSNPAGLVSQDSDERRFNSKA